MSSVRASGFLLACFSLVVFAGLPGRAQLDAPGPQRLLSRADGGNGDDASELTITKRVNEVNLIFTVTDKHGRFVNNLTQDQVQVLDDHRPPSQITYFQAQTDLPLRVALLVDTSDSVAERFAFEQRAAAAFLRQSLRPPSDAGLVLGFDSEIHLMQSLTSDVGLLSSAVTRLTTGGTTLLYDSIRYASEKLRRGEDRPLRRAIVIITDGVDNGSKIKLEDAITAALRAEVVIFALSTSRPIYPDGNAGTKALARLTQATGGRVLAASSDREIAKAFTSIQQQLRSQYALGYKPADLSANGQYRSIELPAHPKKRYRAYHRQGYYVEAYGLLP